MWSTVNVTVDPSLRRMLFDGEINLFVCKKCGHRIRIVAPLLYHNMNLRFCVQYYPPGCLDDTASLRRFKPDGSPVINLSRPGGLDCDYLMNPHIVFDMAEKLRYVTFREGIAKVKKGRRKPSLPSSVRKKRTID